MLRLALLAALLLAFAPALSRLLGNGGLQRVPGWTEICTAVGMKWMKLPGSAAADASMPAAPMDSGEDCAYCLLAASLPLLAVLFFALPWHGHARPVLAWINPRLGERINLRGLGAQGPPLLF